MSILGGQGAEYFKQGPFLGRWRWDSEGEALVLDIFERRINLNALKMIIGVSREVAHYKLLKSMS